MRCRGVVGSAWLNDGVMNDEGAGVNLIEVGVGVGVICFVIVEKISESFLIAVIWSSPMLEKGALGAGFVSALANSKAAMVAFSAEEL